MFKLLVGTMACFIQHEVIQQLLKLTHECFPTTNMTGRVTTLHHVNTASA